jgi:predicted CXXCH cytochrome family protein
MIRKEAIFTISLGACILLLSGRLLSSETPGAYVGWKRCAMCHSDISGDWQKGRHAHAFESLKKTGQENLPACLGCHVTGYEQDGGFIDFDITPEMISVQCEECHGRGSEHAVNPAGKVLVKAPGVDLCRRCHTEGQDPAFDYNEKVTGVHGPTH